MLCHCVGRRPFTAPGCPGTRGTWAWPARYALAARRQAPVARAGAGLVKLLHTGAGVGILAGIAASSLPILSGESRKLNERRYLQPTEDEVAESIRWGVMSAISFIPYLNPLVGGQALPGWGWPTQRGAGMRCRASGPARASCPALFCDRPGCTGRFWSAATPSFAAPATCLPHSHFPPHPSTNSQHAQAWVFGALDDEQNASLYFAYAALYTAPYLTSGFRLDSFALLALAAGIAHVQVGDAAGGGWRCGGRWAAGWGGVGAEPLGGRVCARSPEKNGSGPGRTPSQHRRPGFQALPRSGSPTTRCAP